MRKILTLLTVLAIAVGAQSLQFSDVFPGVSVRTSFAYDYGEMFEAVTFEGQEYTAQEAAAVILPRFGWADSANRIRLGTAWAHEVVLFGSEVTDSDANDEQASAEILADGTFRYTVGVVSMRGRRPGSVFTRWQVEINSEGEVRATALESEDGSRPSSPRL